jgi:DNA-binding transcriptional regulator YdaS (Cro superfamily)
MKPEVLEALRQACALSTQSAVAKRIGYSAQVVNQVLKGVYAGDVNRVERAIEGALLNASVECPVVGEIPQQRCVEHQRSPFRATNDAAVQLFHACRGGCPHSLIPKEGA